MGRGAVRGTNAAGIRSYEEAEAACVHIRGLSAASGAPYAVDDLVCFCCSATHTEATLKFALPAAATPVTIELDLGSCPSSSLHPSPSILTEPQPLTRIRRKTTPHATMPSVLVSVLHELLAYVTGIGAASLCYSSRALHAGGMYMTRRNRQEKHRILRSVEGLLYTKLPDMILEGVGRSLLLRTQALACDFIDSCNGLSADELCLAFALFRVCVKFELDEKSRSIVFKHVGAGTQPGIVHQLEWSLLQRLRVSSEPLSIDDKSMPHVVQPLAWDPHAWDPHSDDDSTLLSSGAMR